jgi:outer membrane protein OmpA-like peptidoglycan-associated protein
MTTFVSRSKHTRKPERIMPVYLNPLRQPLASVASTVVAVAAILGSSPAQAQVMSLKIEPGVAIPLTAPQSEEFDVGGSESIKLLFGLGPFFDVGLTSSFTMVPSSDTTSQAQDGVAWGFGGGIRIKGRHDSERRGGLSPWIDADMLLIVTGDLRRPGFDAGAGLSMPIGRTRTFWMGPFARYQQVLQSDRDGFDTRDARFLTAGLSFEVGTGLPRVEPIVIVPEPCPACPIQEPVYVTTEVLSCPDADEDTIPDTIDRCPLVPGLMEHYGCPFYESVVIAQDRLVLNDSIYFAFDDSTIEPVSFNLLNTVAQALTDSPGAMVRIQGHTDSSGSESYNQTLSEERARSVLDYLVEHGVARTRLTSQGFGEGTPIDTNTTNDGRHNNRRVEFLVEYPDNNSGGAQ